ncbi:MAG TPA: ABC transporter permease [Thermoanaerobaculia bacterium]
MTHKRHEWITRMWQAGIVVVVLAFWEIIGQTSVSAMFFVGRPSAIVIELGRLLREGLVYDLFVTASEAIVGLLIGTAVGTVAGLSLWSSQRTAEVAQPFVVALGSLPVFVVAPLMIVWFGVGFTMKAALAALSTVFVAFNQAYSGAMQVDVNLINNVQGMNASRRQLLVKIIMPASIRWVMNSMKLNVGFSLLGAFIGEFIAAERGLGHVLLKAAGLYNMPRALAAASGICLLAIAFDRAASWIEKRSDHIVQVIGVPSMLWTYNRPARSSVANEPRTSPTV